MSKQILNAERGKVSYFHKTQDGKFAIETVADVTSIVDRAQRLQNDGRLTNPAGDHHLAEIPIVVLNAWAHDRGLTFNQVMSDNSLMREFLNDPNNSAFRVHKGRA